MPDKRLGRDWHTPDLFGCGAEDLPCERWRRAWDAAIYLAIEGLHNLRPAHRPPHLGKSDALAVVAYQWLGQIELGGNFRFVKVGGVPRPWDRHPAPAAARRSGAT